jgi:hypothetical protein
MPELTGRRSPDHREECWHIYYGDIHAGTITEPVGNPHDTDRWEWCCGFTFMPDGLVNTIAAT